MINLRDSFKFNFLLDLKQYSLIQEKKSFYVMFNTALMLEEVINNEEEEKPRNQQMGLNKRTI